MEQPTPLPDPVEPMTPPRVQDLRLFRVAPGTRGRSAVAVQLWWLVQATLFAWSPQVAYRWRAWLLRRFGCTVGEDVVIRPSVRIMYPWRVTIGDRCQIGDGAELLPLGEISIGADAVVSQRSYLCAGSHDARDPAFPIVAAPIRIEEEAWVCTDVFVYPGVTVGRGAVISARSVLMHDARPYGLYAGFPARWQGDRRRPDAMAATTA